MPSVDEYIEQRLTDGQAAAATDPLREVLCLACAGSGKSRTLATRVARLLADGVEAEAIVAFTFTEKAAESIKRRIAEVLEECGFSVNLLGRMYVGTIHSFCQNILGQADAKYRQFDVLDDNRLHLYLMSRYGQLHIADIRSRAQGGSYFDAIRKVAAAWKVCQDEGITVAQVAAEDATLGNILTALRDSLETNQFMDFGSMIRLVVELAHKGDPAVLAELGRIKHLLCDEYQDVAPSQEALIKAIHAQGAHIFVVGDDDQAIYSWRGADVQNILTFEKRYPKAGTHTLETNYRSTRAIVDSSAQFIHEELGAARLTKNPKNAHDAPHRELHRFHFSDRAVEADWVIERIRALVGTQFTEKDGTVRGLTYGDFAILMSSTRSEEQAGFARHFPFTSRMNAAGVPYSLEAGGSPFDRLQLSSLRKVFSLLAAGTPTRTEAQAFFNTDLVPAFPNADFNAFAKVTSEWSRRIHSPVGGVRQRLFPQQLLFELLEAFRLAEHPLPPEVMQEVGLFSRMIQDVEAVYLSVDSAARFSMVARFLEFIADDGYNISTDDVVLRPDVVTVGTVHSVKGLEFPVVFVVDVQAGRFPGKKRGYEGFVPANLIQAAVNRGAYTATREAQARLFYTAMTRAEAFLYITGSQMLPGGKRANSPSAFALRVNDVELSTNPATVRTDFPKATPAPRVDEATLPTSFSDVRYYLHCPMDYRFRRNWGFSPPIPELFGFGRAVHVAVEKLHELYPNGAPTQAEAAAVANSTFHLKHIAPSSDPVARPGAYEQAKKKAAEIAADYAKTYADDFVHRRQVEARFEIPAQGCVITGSIDLLIREGQGGAIREAEVVDFKAMEAGPDPAANAKLDWTALSLQVQLYAKAARDVLGENAAVGSVHLLKDNQRVDVPIDAPAVSAAIENVEWAVQGILAQEFPMRPHPEKCGECDFKTLCPKQKQAFSAGLGSPPAIHTPAGAVRALALSQVTP